MMCGMREAPHHDPGAASAHVKKSCVFFEPGLRHLLQFLEPLARRSSIGPKKLQAVLDSRQPFDCCFDPQKILHPIVLADALMDHLFEHTAAARLGPPRHLDVFEHGPNAKDFLTLGAVGVDEKGITIHLSDLIEAAQPESSFACPLRMPARWRQTT